jgi:Armadillo-like
MEQLGTDFDATGSVMSRAELEEQRRKRGECITCGRKCFQKKLFKMIPITDHGRVLNGRCLNCNPLDAADGALPAVSRPATQADLARFTRSQNNLRSQSAGSNSTPPPEQRQIRPSNQRHTSHSSMSSSVASSINSGSRLRLSISGESVGSGMRQALMQASDAQSVSSRSSSRGREVQTVAAASLRSSGSVSSTQRPLQYHSNSSGSSAARRENSSLYNIQPTQLPEHDPRALEEEGTGGERLAEFYEQEEELDQYDDQSQQLINLQHHLQNGGHNNSSKDNITDESFRSLTSSNAAPVDFYQRSFHKSSSFRSAHSHGSNNSDGSPDLTANSATNGEQRRLRRPPSREGSMDGAVVGLPTSGEGRRLSYSSMDRGNMRRTASNESLDSASLHGPTHRLRAANLNASSSLDVIPPLRAPSGYDDDRNLRSSSNQMDLLASLGELHHFPPPAAAEPRQRYATPPAARSTPSSELETAMQLFRDAGNNFVDMVKCMQDFHTSLDVQVFALHTISNMELTVEDSILLASVGVIQVILDTMDAFPRDLELQVSGCRAIWNASGTHENQWAFVDFGALDVLLHAMSNFADDAVLQEQALAVLANLGAHADNLDRIHDAHVMEKLVETLGRHASNPDVQIKGCLALSNFASHPTDYAQTIVDCGGGSAIVVSMVMHPNNSELQERALRALRNLSANSDRNRVELTNIGGIDAIISAMQVHRDSADVQQVGAWTLSNLAGNPDSKVLIGDCGGIDVIIRAMWVHNDKAPVQEWCSRALYSLSSDSRNSRMIIELGGISAVVNAMQAHVDAVAVQEMGCAILCNLATDQQSKMRIVDEEALDAVVLAMVLFSDDAKVQERSCQLLLQLSIAENFKAMQASNVGELVVAAAQKFPDRCAEPAERLIKVIEGFIAEYL